MPNHKENGLKTAARLRVRWCNQLSITAHGWKLASGKIFFLVYRENWSFRASLLFTWSDGNYKSCLDLLDQFNRLDRHYVWQDQVSITSGSGQKEESVCHITVRDKRHHPALLKWWSRNEGQELMKQDSFVALAICNPDFNRAQNIIH